MAKKEIDIRAEVRKYIERVHKTQAAAAAHWGVSPAFVSAVLSGLKMMPDYMANDAGYEIVQHVAEWRRIKK